MSEAARGGPEVQSLRDGPGRFPEPERPVHRIAQPRKFSCPSPGTTPKVEREATAMKVAMGPRHPGPARSSAIFAGAQAVRGHCIIRRAHRHRGDSAGNTVSPHRFGQEFARAPFRAMLRAAWYRRYDRLGLHRDRPLSRRQCGRHQHAERHGDAGMGLARGCAQQEHRLEVLGDQLGNPDDATLSRSWQPHSPTPSRSTAPPCPATAS